MNTRRSRKTNLFLLIAMMSGLVALGTVGCSTNPNPPRPTLAPSPTAQVIVQVVTSTPVTIPATPAIQEATITPLVTLTPIGGPAPTGTPAAGAGATATRAPAAGATATVVRSPTLRPASTPTSAPGALAATRTAAPPPPAPSYTYPAVRLIEPAGGTVQGIGRDLQFRWDFPDGAPVKLSNSSDCYLLLFTSTGSPSNRVFQDSFDSCSFPGSFTLGNRVTFVLNRPKFAGPNYSSLVAGDDGDYAVQWCVVVVHKTGQIDPNHITSSPASPSSCSAFGLSSQ